MRLILPATGFLLILAFAAPALAGEGLAPTVAPDLPPPERIEASLYFLSDPGDYIGGGEEVTLTHEDGTFSAQNYGPGTVGVSFSSTDGSSWWTLEISTADDTPLRPGSYENALRWPFNDGSPGLSFTGNGRGCNEVSGRFDVLQITFKPDGTLERLAVDFEQHCEGGEAALFGQIRYAPAAVPSPPEGPWLTSAELPGYRVKVRVAAATGPIPGMAVPACIEDTLCVSGAVAGRSELFVRILGPRPNGYYWPVITRFTPSQVEIWVEQISSQKVNYYFLPAGQRDNPSLPGVVDRTGFLP